MVCDNWFAREFTLLIVLILVLMEYGLRLLHMEIVRYASRNVLILVLMEYGLRPYIQYEDNNCYLS